MATALAQGQSLPPDMLAAYRAQRQHQQMQPPPYYKPQLKQYLNTHPGQQSRGGLGYGLMAAWQHYVQAMGYLSNLLADALGWFDEIPAPATQTPPVQGASSPSTPSAPSGHSASSAQATAPPSFKPLPSSLPKVALPQAQANHVVRPASSPAVASTIPPATPTLVTPSLTPSAVWPTRATTPSQPVWQTLGFSSATNPLKPKPAQPSGVSPWLLHSQ